MCWSLFLITLQAWVLQQRVFPTTIAKFIKSNCFYRSLPLAAFYCNNQSKIIQEITASKFQGEHATLLNRYQSLCPATKSEITVGFPMEFWEILEKLPSRVILVGCFCSKFQGEHARLLNRYQSLCPATKSEITAGFPMEFWEILEKLPSRVILVGCFWKENRRRRTCSDPLGFRF